MHLRNRYLFNKLARRRKAFPITGVLGARQAGKSTLLRDIVAKHGELSYVTLDRPNLLRDARARPEAFVLSHTEDFTKPLIIDEAHKAPDLFDVLKVLADERRKRGIIVITGSVDFLKVSGVRETLTGRIGLSRLYPLTVGEIAQRPFEFRCKDLSTLAAEKNFKSTTHEVDTWLLRGGMPGMCIYGEDSVREEMIEEWLQSICHRDLVLLKPGTLDGAVAREVLSLIARYPDISEAELARKTGENTRRIKQYTVALESLFVLYRIKPFKEAEGAGFDRFVLHDAAVARYLGADQMSLYRTFVINELLAQHEYEGCPPISLFHLSRRGVTKVELVVKRRAGVLPLVITERASCDHYFLKRLMSVLRDGTFSSIGVLSPIGQSTILEKGIVQIPLHALGC